MIFNVGDFVLLKNSRQRVGQVKSFEPKFNGPYVVKKIISDFNFEILDPQDGKTLVVHYDRLIKYNMRKNTNVAVNFNQEVLDDNWQENRLRLALFVNRQKKAAQLNIDSNLNPNVQENPVLSNQSILIDDDQANISNFNLDNSKFFDSEQTILEDRDPND